MRGWIRFGVAATTVLVALGIIVSAQNVGLWTSSATGVSTGGTMSVTGASTLGGVATVTAANVRGIVVSRNSADAGIQLSSNGGSGTAYGWVSDTAGNSVWQHDADANPTITQNGAANSLVFAATGGFTFANGRINTNTSQPGFLAFNSADDAGLSSGQAIDFDSEVYDNGGSFSSDTFQAPFNGTYLLCASVTVDPVTLGQVVIATSNRSYVIGRIETDKESAMGGCVHADMESPDIATVTVVSPGGFDSMGSASPYETWFSGRLVP